MSAYISTNYPKRKEKKKNHLVRMLVALVVLFFLCVGIGFWVLSTHSPALEGVQHILIVPSKIDGFRGKIIFINFDPSKKKVTEVLFPPESKVDLIGGYGSYPLQSVYPLLTLDKRDTSFITATYSFALKQVVDQVWVTDDQEVFSAPDDLRQLGFNLMKYHIHSPLQIGDRLRLYRSFLQIDKNQVDTLSVIDDHFQFPDIDPACSVAVVNAFGKSGIGTQFSNVIEKSGLTVIRLTDDPNLAEHSQLLRADADHLCDAEVNHVKNLMPLKLTDQSNNEFMSKYRANVVLLLGKDLSAAFTQK